MDSYDPGSGEWRGERGKSLTSSERESVVLKGGSDVFEPGRAQVPSTSGEGRVVSGQSGRR